MTLEDVRRRWPRIVAHMISESLGYCTIDGASRIVLDGKLGRANYCEWLYSCHDCNARKVLNCAIKRRTTHTGYMAEYKLAKALVDRANQTGEEPLFASWF